MHSSFSTELKSLRHQAKLTNHELARLANVPESLVSGLQNNNRRVGEFQARKIGCALLLTGDALEQFIYHAINTSAEKVLKEAQPYPSRILNLLAVQLMRAGISAESINDFTVAGDHNQQNIHLTLGNGQRATIKTQLVSV